MENSVDFKYIYYLFQNKIFHVVISPVVQVKG